jgi:hypothetical protein
MSTTEMAGRPHSGVNFLQHLVPSQYSFSQISDYLITLYNRNHTSVFRESLSKNRFSYFSLNRPNQVYLKVEVSHLGPSMLFL